MRNSSVYWPLHLITFVIGLLLAMTVLSGDSFGRVNLLHLLLLYFVLPVVGAMASIYALIFNGKAQLTQRILGMGLFNLAQQPIFKEIRQANKDRDWLLQQSQIMAMVFALSNVIALMMVLLFSDIAFIWRSTLLTPEPVYAALKFIASPWFFWSSAQPELSLLQATQEYRLTDNVINPNDAGSWWLFILATQLFYSIFLRGLIFLYLHWQLKKVQPLVSSIPDSIESVNPQASQATPNAAIELESLVDYTDVFIWHSLPTRLEQHSSTIALTEKVRVNPWEGTAEQLALLRHSQQPLIVVKGWEPPMAELSDVIKDTQGYLLILGWQNNELSVVNPIQQDEWARFCEMHNWQLVIAVGVDDAN